VNRTPLYYNVSLCVNKINTMFVSPPYISNDRGYVKNVRACVCAFKTGLTLAIMSVCAFPPNESHNSFVSADSRYGTNGFFPSRDGICIIMVCSESIVVVVVVVEANGW